MLTVKIRYNDINSISWNISNFCEITFSKAPNAIFCRVLSKLHKLVNLMSLTYLNNLLYNFF